MNDYPLVSVCIPAYNNAAYIEETILSVLSSTYQNLELILVDDKSTDKTLSTLYEIQSRLQDDRIVIYENEENLGMAGNWNRCLSLCQGKYIRLLCADDLIDSALIEEEVEILEANPDAVLVSSDTQFVDLYGSKAGYYRRYHKSGLINGRDAVKFSVFTRDYLGAPLANLFRRSAYEALGGFDESFHFIIDYDFFMKLYLSGQVYVLHKPLNYFRIRSDSNTGQVMGGGEEEAYIDEHRRLMEKYQESIGLSSGQVALSVTIRRFMSFLGNIYLKIFVPGR